MVVLHIVRIMTILARVQIGNLNQRNSSLGDVCWMEWCGQRGWACDPAQRDPAQRTA